MFHQSTSHDSQPEWVPTPRAKASSKRNTRKCAFALEDMAACAVLAGRKTGETEDRFQVHGSVLEAASGRRAASSFKRTFTQGHVRLDNLRLIGGRLILFDWAQASNFPSRRSRR